MANKPINTIKYGGVQLSIWENELPDGKGTTKTITVDKSYKAKDGEWKRTSNYKAGDLALLILALTDAQKYIYGVTSF